MSGYHYPPERAPRRPGVHVDGALAMLAPGAVITFAESRGTRTVVAPTFPGSASIYYRTEGGAVFVATRHAFREWLITGEVTRVDPAP